MESRRQNVSEAIPIDLIIEIFSRLPTTSIGRCRCVSKLWFSILVRPDFTELFLTRSSSRLQLLFICKKNGELFFFSTPQPQNPDENSSPLVASYHMKIPHNSAIGNFSPMRGLIFLRNTQLLEGNWNIVTVICYPSTGQSLTLPKVNTIGIEIISYYYGYDPVEKQFKVLSMKTSSVRGRHEVVSEEHQVLTLGSGEWRKIECCIPHYPLGKGICIDGVVYYPALINSSSRVYMIVCFDVKSEKFASIQATETYFKVASNGFMINCNGKLGVLAAQGSGYVNGKTWGFKLCVLENAEKNEWSEHTYVPSPSYCEVVGNTLSRFVGVTQANEIVLSPYYLNSTGPFYIIYYSIERNTFIRVEIQGMEACKGSTFYTFLDHVENVKLMQMI